MAYRSSSAGSSGGSPVSTSVPAGAAIDDIAILTINADNANAATYTWPSGFTEIAASAITHDLHGQAAAWKRLTAADSGTYDVSLSAGNNALLIAALFSGRHASDPPVLTEAINNSGNSSPISVNATGVTAIDGDDLVWIGGLDTLGSVGNGCAPPSGYTERQDAGGGADVSNISLATLDDVAAGATGTVTGTYSLTSSTAGWAAYLIRIPVAGGGGGGGNIIAWITA